MFILLPRGEGGLRQAHSPAVAGRMRGYLADLTPAREYEECQNKARAVLRAFELAEKGL